MKRINNKHKIEKAKFLLIIPILFLLIGGVLAYHQILDNKQKSNIPTKPTPTINITYQNIASQLSRTSMIKDLPNDATLLLKFYNYNTGERQWEKSYLITKGNMIEAKGDEKVDIILTLSSNYLKGLTNKNFCSMIKQAKKDGSLGFETSLSTTSLAWKFKSMYSYRECLGF